MTARQGLATRAFWIIVAALFLSSISVNGAVTHLSALLTDRGVTAAKAALALSVIATTCANFFNKSTRYVIDMKNPTRLALTMGDPAGVGPEIILKAAHALRGSIEQGDLELHVLGSRDALQRAIRQCALPSGTDLLMRMVDVGPVDGAVETGRIAASGGQWAYLAVERAVRMIQS